MEPGSVNKGQHNPVFKLLKNVCRNQFPQNSIWIFLNAIVPSDHKSALIESLVPGTRLWNHLGQGLKAAEATPNVTYDTKKIIFKITSSKVSFFSELCCFLALNHLKFGSYNNKNQKFFFLGVHNLYNCSSSQQL